MDKERVITCSAGSIPPSIYFYKAIKVPMNSVILKEPIDATVESALLLVLEPVTVFCEDELLVLV